jgi:hypothetical protein
MVMPTAALNAEITAARATNWRSSVIAVVLALSIAGYFWVDSRYPSLLRVLCGTP